MKYNINKVLFIILIISAMGPEAMLVFHKYECNIIMNAHKAPPIQDTKNMFIVVYYYNS